MHKNKTTQKGGGDLQLTLQVKTYKPQTNSLNKHYPQKCKTKNEHTKGRGVGNLVHFQRRLRGWWSSSTHFTLCSCLCLCSNNLHKRMHTSKTTQGGKQELWMRTCTRQHIGTRLDKGRGGRRTLNEKKSSIFLSSFKAKENLMWWGGSSNDVEATKLLAIAQ